jgi:hypothetical protein
MTCSCSLASRPESRSSIGLPSAAETQNVQTGSPAIGRLGDGLGVGTVVEHRAGHRHPTLLEQVPDLLDDCVSDRHLGPGPTLGRRNPWRRRSCSSRGHRARRSISRSYARRRRSAAARTRMVPRLPELARDRLSAHRLDAADMQDRARRWVQPAEGLSDRGRRRGTCDVTPARRRASTSRTR